MRIGIRRRAVCIMLLRLAGFGRTGQGGRAQCWIDVIKRLDAGHDGQFATARFAIYVDSGRPRRGVGR